MDFDEAVRVHTFWKVTLRWLVNGDKVLDVERFGDHHACELGRWIDDQREQLARYPAYETLELEHAEFHRLAGEVARLAVTGEREEAAKHLAPEGDFSLASARTILAILALKEQVESASSKGR